MSVSIAHISTTQTFWAYSCTMVAGFYLLFFFVFFFVFCMFSCLLFLRKKQKQYKKKQCAKYKYNSWKLLSLHQSHNHPQTSNSDLRMYYDHNLCCNLHSPIHPICKQIYIKKRNHLVFNVKLRICVLKNKNVDTH